MKKGILAFAIASVITGSPVSFNIQRAFSLQQTSIAGKIFPESGAEIVRIIGVKDSARVAVVAGNFIARVKPGKYKLIVHTRAPFKNAQLDNLEVKQNQSLDIGEIILQ
ncbi:MAG TPA: hypothetical protein VIZ28_04960 [Chitinophagaceae bacterium]